MRYVQTILGHSSSKTMEIYTTILSINPIKLLIRLTPWKTYVYLGQKMNTTSIYTTRKLEKTVKELISVNEQKTNNYLGDWTSTIFYVSHKKCWLIINNLTKYLLILENVKKSDLKNINTIFKQTLHSQFKYDGIDTGIETIEKIIGKIELHGTNNNQSANGSLNNCLLYLDDWKFEYGNFENMDFRDLNNRLNSSPNKMLNWKHPKEKMRDEIKAYAQHRV